MNIIMGFCDEPAVGSVVDLFCGAGGLSLGLSQCGFEHRMAVDHWPEAIDTYRQNFSGEALCQQVSEDLSLPRVDVIVGGPPCQGFSSAGLRKSSDDRNSLVGVFASLVAKHRPTAFVFENVEGFLTSAGGGRVIELLRPLVAAGYRIHLRKVNAANFGVAQHRKRVIAIGALGIDPFFPETTHTAFGAPGAGLAGATLPLTATLRDAIGDLPPYACSAASALIDDHYAVAAEGGDLERAKLLQPGQRMCDLPAALQHESYTRRANRRVKDGTPSEQRGGAPAGVRRLRWDEPCKAITSGARHEFLHPDEHRSLSLRECARIQSFPDTFKFTGTAVERSLQIGNAVPPKLGSAIGFALLRTLELSKHTSIERPGKLLTFVPTLSQGMSPALKETISAVNNEFADRQHQTKSRQSLLWH